MKFKHLMTTVVAAATCALVATALSGGIASSSAAAKAKAKTKTAAARGDGLGHFGHGPEGFGGPAVHEEAVVLNKAGTAFITATRDNGTFVSLSGDQLTIHEGTTTVAYKDVTLTIPAGATVTRNGKTAALTDLKAGDRVGVSASSDGTTVFANDGTWHPGGRGDNDGLRHP